MNSYIKIICLLLVFVTQSCNNEEKIKEVDISIEANNIDTIIVQHVTDTVIAKSKEEVYVDLAIKGLKFGRDLFKKMKTNDSVKLSEREKLYAYQIGLPIRDKKVLFNVYNSLNDKDDIYVLKTKKDFYIIKYNGSNENELNDSLDQYKKKTGQEIFVKDIMQLCSKNRKIVRSEDISSRKESSEIPCLVCDK